MHESHSVMSNSLRPHGLYSSWNSPGQNTGVGSFSLLQGIFPTQGSNPGFLHCWQILYQLIHKGRPRILEWVAYHFSSGSSQPRNPIGVLHCKQILYQLSYQGSPIFFFFFLFMYFYQLEANYFTTLQWVLSYIDMNQPWIYMYSPSQSPLPPPSPPIPLGLPSAPGPSTCLMHPTWAGDLFHYR